MTKPIFKPGDHIVLKEFCSGIDHATVTNVDDRNYYLKISCGKAIVPISVQQYYKLDESK